MEFIQNMVGYMPQLLAFFPVTVQYVLASLLFGSLFAMVLAVMKLSGVRPLKWVADGITTLGRCCPTIIMLFLAFYGLPPLLRSLTGIDIEGLEPIYFVVASFTFFLGGSLSEVARSAYLGIDKGQFEAAACCGMTQAQAIVRIILPQLLYLMIPNLGNTVQFLMKEGALTYLIGCIDLTGAAYLINGREMSAHVLEVYLALALIFWVLSIAVDWAFAKLERKFGVGYRSPSERESDRPARLFGGGDGYKADVVGIRRASGRASA